MTDSHPVIGAAQLPGHSVVELRDGYRARKAQLFGSLRDAGASTRGVSRMLRDLARLADEALQQLWRRAGFPPDFALVAVGGFGRGELFPHSDVDVLLLLPEGTVAEGNETLQRKLEGFIGSCWDAGLEIGSSVRTVEECLAQAAGDVTVQTSLLESRLVTGNRAL